MGDRRTAVTEVATMPNGPSAVVGLNPPTTARFKNEDKMIDVIRSHLREARNNSAIGKITFDLDIKHGGVARFFVELNVNYRFIENAEAI